MFTKLTSFLLSFLFIISFANAQDATHVNWKVSSEKIDENTIQLTYTGSIEKGWKVYEKNAANELEGIRTKLEMSTGKAEPLKILTPVTQAKDPIFETTLGGFSNEVVATQLIKYPDAIPATQKLKIFFDVANAEEFLPEEQRLTATNSVVTSTVSGDSSSVVESVAKDENRILIPTIDIKKPVEDCTTNLAASASDTESKGLLHIFLLGFLGGLVALIMPCLFPMIPLTVSFFTKRSQSRKQGIFNAFLYGFFIFLIYVLLSLPFHFVQGINPAILNNISTNVTLNVIFFLIFVLFSLSFFGLFEITLPSSVGNKVDSKGNVGNIIGIFFMALTLAIVSFSCTGPIIGTLLASSLSSNGGAMQLTSGMAGFGVAIGLPFALFALFPNWLNSLPKSGGWLNSVKVVLGFVELALALKFLSNADLVSHWNILKREIFIGIWIVISLLLTLYLFGLLKFPHDPRPKKLPLARKVLGVLMAAFTLYLIPGVTNTKYNNLKLISGFPPPLYYSIYAKENDCILGLNCAHDYETGLRMAKEQNKKLLIDFTGYACVNCRKMEESVWSKPDVYQLMKDNFIVVSLYVDDKAVLPPNQQMTYKTKDGSEKEIITVGDKWATFQTENFANNAQPWYAIIDTSERLMSKPVGYVPNSKEYLDWMKCGLNAK